MMIRIIRKHHPLVPMLSLLAARQWIHFLVCYGRRAPMGAMKGGGILLLLLVGNITMAPAAGNFLAEPP